MKKNKAFTLIELIAVLVILAILALIVTPLVLNIIKKARTAADKRSIDAYGRSIELAIADYLLDKGTFPTSIEQLTIEYTGDKVECETTTLKEDGSVYLAECTVAGRSVTGYTYGKEEAAPTYEAYNVGDEVAYNNVNYYVIKDSGTSESSVTLLKAELLTYEEVQTYSAGTGAQTSDNNGYGEMQYGTTSDYSTSYVKTTVDAWAEVAVPSGLEQVRLITIDELKNFNYGEEQDCGGGCKYTTVNEDVPTWVYNSNNSYWTMSLLDSTHNNMWYVQDSGDLSPENISYRDGLRPVIVLSKSVL